MSLGFGRLVGKFHRHDLELPPFEKFHYVYTCMLINSVLCGKPIYSCKFCSPKSDEEEPPEQDADATQEVNSERDEEASSDEPM